MGVNMCALGQNGFTVLAVEVIKKMRGILRGSTCNQNLNVANDYDDKTIYLLITSMYLGTTIICIDRGMLNYI